MTLGDIVRQYRVEHGMSMQDFADVCNLSKAYISILERNHNPKSGKPPTPSLETIRAIANAMGVDFNEIIAATDGGSKLSQHQTPMQTHENLEFRIRRLRKQRGLTMKQLGEMLGIAESTVSQYETGKREPSIEVLLQLSRIFGVTVGYILGAEEEPLSDCGLCEYLDMLKTRPECRTLFSLLKDTTPKDVQRTIAIVEGLRRIENE